MKKSFPVPFSNCSECESELTATVMLTSPYLEVRCNACSNVIDFGETGADMSREVRKKAKRATAALSKSLVELRNTVPKNKKELDSVIRNPRHPFTATLLTGAVLLLMEMSGFGIFMIVAWVLGNLILNPFGWVLIPVIVAIGFAYRRVFAKESFEKIRAQVAVLQERYERGEMTKPEFENARDQAIAGAFDDVAIEEVLKDGDYNFQSIERIRGATTSSKPEWIWNADHLEALRQAIADVEHRLFIYSGWLGVQVIDVIFDDLLAAVQRGVIVHIGYGWQSISGPEEESDLERRALERLGELGEVAGSKSIIVKRFPNHSKLLVCDDKYIICGSANWLNNRAYRNREISIRLFDTELVNRFLDESAADFNTPVSS